MYNCDEMINLIPLYADGGLDETERAALEEHLAGCELCRALERELADMVRSLRELPSVEPPSGFSAEWKRRVGILSETGLHPSPESDESRGVPASVSAEWKRGIGISDETGLHPSPESAESSGVPASVSAEWKRGIGISDETGLHSSPENGESRRLHASPENGESRRLHASPENAEGSGVPAGVQPVSKRGAYKAPGWPFRLGGVSRSNGPAPNLSARAFVYAAASVLIALVVMSGIAAGISIGGSKTGVNSGWERYAYYQVDTLAGADADADTEEAGAGGIGAEGAGAEGLLPQARQPQVNALAGGDADGNAEEAEAGGIGAEEAGAESLLPQARQFFGDVAPTGEDAIESPVTYDLPEDAIESPAIYGLPEDATDTQASADQARLSPGGQTDGVTAPAPTSEPEPESMAPASAPQNLASASGTFDVGGADNYAATNFENMAPSSASLDAGEAGGYAATNFDTGTDAGAGETDAYRAENYTATNFGADAGTGASSSSSSSELSKMASSTITLDASSGASDNASYRGASSDASSGDFKRTFTVTIRTDDYADTMNRLKSMGGWVVSSREELAADSYAGGSSAYILRRVDAAGYEAAKAELRQSGEVAYENESLEKLTGLIQDTKARIRAKSGEVDRLTALLGESEAIDVMTMVEGSLGTAASELDGLLGQLRYYEDITRSPYLEVTVVANRISPPPDPPQTLGARIGERFIASWNSAARFFEALAVWLSGAVVPLAVSAAIIAAAIFVVRKSNSRRRGHDK